MEWLYLLSIILVPDRETIWLPCLKAIPTYMLSDNGRNITYLFNIKNITVKSLNYKAVCFKRNCCDDRVCILTLVTNNFIMKTGFCLQQKVIPNIPITPSYMFCSLHNTGGSLLDPGKSHSLVSPINLFYTNGTWISILHIGKIICKFIHKQNLYIPVIISAIQPET